MKPTPKRKAKEQAEKQEAQNTFNDAMQIIISRIKQLELEVDRIKTRLGLE